MKRLPRRLLFFTLLIMIAFLPQIVMAEEAASEHKAPYIYLRPDPMYALKYDESVIVDIPQYFERDPETFYIADNEEGPYRKLADDELNWRLSYDGKDEIKYYVKAANAAGESDPMPMGAVFCDEPAEKYLEYSVGKNGVTITGSSKRMKTINIPSYIEGKPVTTLEYLYAEDVAVIGFPDTLKTISGLTVGNYITELVIPEGVTALNCKGPSDSLRRVSLPSTLSRTTNRLLSECKNIYFEVAPENKYFASYNGSLYTADYKKLIQAGNDGSDTLRLADATESIAPYAAAGTSFKVVELNEGLKQIGSYAFAHTQIESIRFPSTIEDIGEYAFTDTDSLEEINLTKTKIKEIGPRAFYKCGAKRLLMPDTLVQIDEQAFWGANIEYIRFSQSLKYIGEEAFMKNPGVQKLELPDGLIDIARNCFDGWYLLEEVHLPDSLTALGSRAFRGTAIREIVLPDNILSVEGSPFDDCNNLISVKLPDNLVSLGTLGDCPSLNTIIVPASVQNVSARAFGGCPNLNEVIFLGNQPEFGKAQPNDINTAAFSGLPQQTAMNLHIYYLPGTIWEKEIYDKCADGDNYTYTTEAYADFADNQGLLLIPAQSVLSYEVGKTYFDSLRATAIGIDISELVWSSSNQDIATVDGNGAITGLQEGWTDIVAKANCDDKIYEDSLRIYVTDNCPYKWSLVHGDKGISVQIDGLVDTTLTELNIPETIAGLTVTDIGENAFNGNEKITSVKLPDTIQEIWRKAFYKCSNLKTIDLGNGVHDIREYAFAETGVEEIYLPPCIEYSWGYMFANCQNLTKATINTPKLGNFGTGKNFFDGCTSLKDVTIEEGVTNIAYQAFRDCVSLERLELPSTISDIGFGAFAGTTSLKELIFKEYPFNTNDILIKDLNENITIVHPDDGNDWDFIGGNIAQTRIDTALNRIDSAVMPSPQVTTTAPFAVRPFAEFANGPEQQGLPMPEQSNLSDMSGDEENTNEPDDSANTEPQETQTMFEVVRNTIQENPLITAAFMAVFAAIIVLAGYNRYRRNDNR